jgi:hypothetical protein
VRLDKVTDFKRHVAVGYEEATGIAPDIYSSTAVAGVAEDLPIA